MMNKLFCIFHNTAVVSRRMSFHNHSLTKMARLEGPKIADIMVDIFPTHSAARWLHLSMLGYLTSG
mgnify:CR=1 FL=1